jgi:hypothetical protein
MFAQSGAHVVRGTINVALANANGMVVLTDSMQTISDQGDDHQLPDPAQKLFRLDDKTVCAIAGFLREDFPTAPPFDTAMARILATFKNQLSQQPVPDFDAKLQALRFLVEFYLNAAANLNEVTPGLNPDHTYESELIVAGYDANGAAKLGTIEMTETTEQGPDGHFYRVNTSVPATESVNHELLRVVHGIPDVGNRILDTPQDFSESSAVRTYEQSLKRHKGASLTTPQMEELAKYIAAQTAHVHKAVGGPNQVAVLANGTIAIPDQPAFPEPEGLPNLWLIMGAQMNGRLPFEDYSKHRATRLWIRATFDDMKMETVDLDGQFFYACTIRDSIVRYNGGTTGLDASNDVMGSWLVLGPLATSTEDSRDEIQRLRSLFTWRSDQPPQGGEPFPPN